MRARLRTSASLWLGCLIGVHWIVATLGFSAHAQSPQPAVTSCQACHQDPEWVGEDSIEIVRKFHNDIHRERGLGCHSCHGGNPDPALADDMTGAMDPDFEQNPYRGVPAKAEIPEFCGTCHSSFQFMRRFNPAARVDQAAEYWTSHHGQALRRGDTKVATCTDCHGVHGMLGARNPEGPVYPTRVAQTCGTCHSDAAYMAGYRTAEGHPMPVDQVARWQRSVHANALLNKGDLTAPTCNDCHGNHGAAPPDVEDITYVCGHCHGRESELFRASPKHAAFETHNSFMTGGATCNDCHDGIAANVQTLSRFTECTTCHENHGVIRPTIALLGFLPESPCALCHEPLSAVLEPRRASRQYAQVKTRLLTEAERAGISGEERFNWLIDRALTLPMHTAPSVGEDGQPILRPEFRRLFSKFRIGKTTYSFVDPVSNREVSVRVRQCADCHIDSDGIGLQTAQRHLTAMRQLIGLTARAERLLLAAHRGGVETRHTRHHVDAAVDSQIELEVLVHTFERGGEFDEKYREGVQHASLALAAGTDALEEIDYRRRGLFFALGAIVLLLVALGLKIRQISAGG
jgi:nitrate/TMAO reductase-like tetraheme cytochrome c subunit